MKNRSVFLSLIFLLVIKVTTAQETGTFTDARDGKIYKTVKIGTQTWMAENLAFKAASGCWAYNNMQGNVAIYGYLYDWATAKIACPAGWHLPTNNEWTTLTTNFGGDSIAARELKSTLNWISPNTTTNNKSGFTALPGGYRNVNESYSMFGFWGYWWSSTEDNSDNNTDYAWYRFMFHNISEISSYYLHKESGLSVRCIKD